MYEEKYVRRGEIYRVRLDTGWESEQGATRPALIISSTIGNDTSPTVIVAYLTTKDHNIGIHYGPTKATGVPAYVCCEQIATVSKKRIVGNIMGSLSPAEMREVEDRLDEVLDLGFVDDAPIKEKEQEISALKIQLVELNSEILRLRTSLEAKSDEILTRDVELAVAKRMYEKAVGVIAAMKAEPDLPKPPQYVTGIEQAKVDKPVWKQKPSKEERSSPDINTATFSQLRSVGFTDSQALAVLNGRPYKKLEDLKNAPGINSKTYCIISPRLCCVPVEVEEPVEEPKVTLDDSTEPEPEVAVEVAKVNVNTAKVGEIKTLVGCSLNAAYAITGYRKKQGRIEKLEEIAVLPYWSETMLEKHRSKMEV